MANQEQMNVDANAALTELAKIYTHDMAAIDLIEWLRRWYLKAGYKRLCRGLLRLAPPPTND